MAHNLYSLYRVYIVHGNRSLPFSISPSHLAFEYAFIQNVIINSLKQFKQKGNWFSICNIVARDPFPSGSQCKFGVI